MSNGARRSGEKKLSRSLVPLGALFLASFATTLYADVEHRDWCVTSSKHFDLISDLPRDGALALLGSLDRFRSASSSLLPGGSDAETPPLKLLVFSRARDFDRTFDSKSMAGFARPSLDQSLLASGPDRDRRHLHRNVFHEYTHYLIRSRAALNLPIWYEEGLASYLATLSVDGDGMAVVGRIPFGYLRRALVDPGISVVDVVAGRFQLGTGDHQMSNTYGVAWALVRFLHHAEAPDGTRYASKLGDMLAAIDEGATSIEAMRSTMGIDVTELRKRLQRYFEDDQLPVYRFRTESADRLAFHRRCLNLLEARFELAEAATFVHPEFAYELYTEIIDKEPGHSGALVGLSRLVDDSRAVELTERALGASPDDASAKIRLAELRVRACQGGGVGDNDPRDVSDDQPIGTSTCAEQIADAISLYGDALRSPGHTGAASYGLGVVSLAVGRPEDAVAYLQAAYSRAPWSPQVNFYLGEAYRLAGDPGRARLHLRKTAYWHPQQDWRDRASRVLASLAPRE